MRLEFDRHELMPRHFGHCAEDSIIQGGLADLRGKVPRDHSDRRNHLSPFLKTFDAHERIVAASSACARFLRRRTCGGAGE
jgi:hypothetical protein